MPKKPDPNNIRRLKGDPNKSRYLPDGVDIDKLDFIPEAPEWINGHALNIFQRYCRLLIAVQVIAETDINSLAMFSWLEAKMIKMIQLDIAPTASMFAQYKSFAGEFGLTTLSREKLRLPQVERKINKYAKQNRNENSNSEK